MRHEGACHCEAVRFEIEAPDEVEVEDCNCSICYKSGYLHLILPLRRFKILAGKEKLTTYTFNTGVAQHYFCSICGIKPFYVPRSNPDGIDVNVRCLKTKPANMTIVPLDGQNWEQHAHKLAHKCQE